VYFDTIYAQANGQVEAANKGIITLIKKKVKENPKSWHEILNQALWDYRNSLRNQLKLLLLGSRLEMMQCCPQKFVSNQLEFRDNVKFLLTIIGIWLSYPNF